MKIANLSVFLPAYNEEANISRTVSNIYKIIPQFAENFEVLVINDGSQDNTAAVLAKLSGQYSNLRVVTHPKNRGYGAALKSGFANCRYEYVFFTDGDGQFQAEEIKKLVDLVPGCDIAAGFRQKRSDPLHRKINAKAYNFLVRLLFGLAVKDIDCAFKIIKKDVLRAVDLKSETQFISAELLIKSKKLGFAIKQAGVVHLARQAGKATGNKPMVVVKSFYELFKLWKELKK